MGKIDWDKLKNKTPKELAFWLEKNIGESENGFYLFNGENDEKIFEENVKYLESDITISLEDVIGWKENGFYIAALTIDGDYIGGTTDKTFEIPKSLVKGDITIYQFSLYSYFINNL